MLKTMTLVLFSVSIYFLIVPVNSASLFQPLVRSKDANEEYPHQTVDEIVTLHGDRYTAVFGNDILTSTGQNNTMEQMKLTGSEFICTSEEKLIHPVKGFNAKNKRVTVVNTPRYQQGVRVETCSHAGRMCNTVEHATSAYTTECVQIYHYRTLLAIDLRTRELYKEHIRLPSGCKCLRWANGQVL